MPAKDRYHDAVVHALIKDGWAITGEQVAVINLIVFDPVEEKIVQWIH